MKKILIPTDFSDCASNASEVALKLAKKHQAAVHFYSCLDIQENWEKLAPTEQEKFGEDKQKIKNAQILLEQWIKRARGMGIPTTFGLSGGQLAKNIQQIIEDQQIDFIVMGSHGASGKSEYFLGSNAQRVVKTIHCPILIIKEALATIDFKNIVFASDFDPKEKQPFQYALDLVRPDHPFIHLLEVNTYGWFSQPYLLAKELMDDFAQMCPPLPCKKYFYRDYSVDAGIRHFAEKVNADLIVISNYNQHPIRRIFQGSSVEAVINHAQRPILCIDFPKTS